MTTLNLVLETAKGEVYDMSRLGITTRDIRISSPNYEVEYASGGGLAGVIELGSTLNARQIVADFYYKAEDRTDDYARRRDELYRLVGNNQAFWLRDMRTPSKRWLVRVDGGFTPDQTMAYGFFEISFIALKGYSESVNIVQRKYEINAIIFDNLGDIAIDPRTQNETEIMFTGASTGLTITNETTGDRWTYTGDTLVGDVILLKGVQSFKNGVSIFRDTNKKLLTFAPGVNKLTISGAPSVNLTIRTRFYFL